MRNSVSKAPQLVPDNAPREERERSYRKLTESAQQGVRYLIACGEFDASQKLVCPEAGEVALHTKNEDILAATRYLRYLLSKKEGAHEGG